MTEEKAQIILAPSREPIRAGNKSVFLSGSTDYKAANNGIDWRAFLTDSLADLPDLTILNPYRPDWDESWTQDETYEPFVEQVNWELDMLDCADLIVVYFYPGTVAIISMLEFGLHAHSTCGDMPQKQVLVVCPDDYFKKGNISIVCKRLGIEMLDTEDELREAIQRKLDLRPT